ncbi:hypothetical protein [Aquiflexum lacus]|uniref:hypothetical protein n=1 Tax=Aquiflexum lacus TaxID=2483805 RepID=UPI001E381115|nr:hypothetical protein [Aquiflexum lacus]
MFRKLFDKIKNSLASEVALKVSKEIEKKYNRRQNFDNLALLIAQQNIEFIKKKQNITNLSDVEMKVFSQMGEDGIIQYLINNINISSKRFVEFGVEDYTESNTRFLLMNNNWEGMIFDGNESNMKDVYQREYAWRHTLTAKHAFVTKDNINSLLLENGFSGNIGLLSIDIDGNDYWVWDSIDVINPDIVICEYNSVFGSERAITIPYNENFYLLNYHYSNLYFGASLMALCYLAEKKGYVLVGTNSAGSNAFFVKFDKAQNLKIFNAKEGFNDSKFRSSRDKSGKLTFISGEQRYNLIKGLKVINVITNELEEI